MKKIAPSKLKKLLIALLVIGIFVFIAFNYGNSFIEKKLRNNQKLNEFVAFSSVEVSILNKTIVFNELKSKREISFKKNAVKGSITKVKVQDFNLWSYLTKKNIEIGKIHFTKPALSLYKNSTPKSIKTDSTAKNKIYIKEIILNNGSLLQLDSIQEDTILSLYKLNSIIKNVTIDGEKTRQKPLPKLEKLSFKNLEYTLGEWEKISVQNLLFQNNNLTAQHFLLATIYSKNELSQYLPKERDYYHIEIPEIQLQKVKVLSNNKLTIQLDKISIIEPLFEFYRDKLLPDDFTTKAFITNQFKQVQIPINIDAFALHNGHLKYAERTSLKREPKPLELEEIHVEIQELNFPLDSTLHIQTSSQLMGNGQFNLDWTFENPAKSTAFLTKGELSHFNTTTLNPFLRANLNVEVEGEIDKMYFTFSGDSYRTTGDMKMNYDDFKFKVLRKDLLGVNKLLTGIVNLFTNDGSKTDAEGYRYGKIETERVAHKSFFNYQWLAIQSGIKETVTGNGKKD